jgi:hypothetical protein
MCSQKLKELIGITAKRLAIILRTTNKFFEKGAHPDPYTEVPHTEKHTTY